MTIRASQSVTRVFTTRRFDTGAATNADSLPTGTLYVSGTADAATVTVTNITTGVYKAAVTMPSGLVVGDVVDLRINATVNSVTDNAVIWQDIVDVALTSGGAVTAGTVSDKTGYALSASGLASVTTWTVAITGNITGNLSGSVGSVTGAVGSVTGAVGSVTGNVGGNVVGSVGSVTSGVTVTTNNDKSGYSLASNGLVSVTAWTVAITGSLSGSVGSVSGNVGGSVASVATGGITAASFAAGAIDSSAIATDAIGSVELAASAVTEIVSGVWDALLSAHTTAGTFGARLLRSSNTQNEVQVTGSNHVAADMHESQPGSIHATTFDAGAIDATALNSDAASEIASAVRTNLTTELGRIDVAVSSRLADADYTAAPSAITVADTVLGRSMSNVETTAAEHSLCTLILGATESEVSGSTWTIYRTDGTTTYRNKTITTDATAEPITAVS